MLTIKHENKEYRWIGDKWGDSTVFDIYFEDRDTKAPNKHIYISTDYFGYEDSKIGFSTRHTVEQLVKLGYMEEVEENPEEKKEKTNPSSILEKLRVELEKKQEEVSDKLSQDIDEMDRRFWEGASSGIEFAKQKLSFLTSLDTKEEPEAIKAAEKYLKDNDYHIAGVDLKVKDWTPIPGDLIEVSNDREKWKKRKFKCIDMMGYCCELTGNEVCSYKYARQHQEHIELPEVPDFKIGTGEYAGRFNEAVGRQVEALTKFCQAITPIVNQLIKANKK